IQIGIIGYTNAGKSTLLNQLTEAGTLEKDILFATLDPLSRKLTLPSGITVIITDTVGFIKDLPTQLIESFKSTLEETRNSDMILHVVDSSNDNILSHEETVEELLKDLEMNQIPKMTIYNKADLMKPNFTPLSYPNTIVSAFNKEDMNRLRHEMEEFLISNMTYYAASIPSYRGDVLAQLKQETIMIKQKYNKAEQVYDVAGYAKEDSYWIHKLSKDEF
ncbi:MAG TPA: GTPase, partial [Alloiococcus sp.]|nr:GTPase [Alloiococcus sp.]